MEAEVLVAEERELTVNAVEGDVPIYTTDPNGNRVRMGTVVYRDYENDRRLRVPMLNGTRKLGAASRRWVPVDHYSVVEPLLANGFQLKTVHHFGEGTEMVAFMTHPEFTIADTIGWDDGIYADYRGDRTMELAVRVRNPIWVGAAINATLGYFRLVCVNGLMVEELGMGHISYSHSNFDAAKFSDWIAASINTWQQPQFPQRESRVLDWPLQVVRDVVADWDNLNKLPSFARTPVHDLLYKLPKWGTKKLVEQMQLCRDNTDVISPLDAINMLTNVAYENPRPERVHVETDIQTRTAWGLYGRMEPLFANFMKLLDIGAFRADMEPFGLGTNN